MLKKNPPTGTDADLNAMTMQPLFADEDKAHICGVEAMAEWSGLPALQSEGRLQTDAERRVKTSGSTGSLQMCGLSEAVYGKNRYDFRGQQDPVATLAVRCAPNDQQ